MTRRLIKHGDPTSVTGVIETTLDDMVIAELNVLLEADVFDVARVGACLVRLRPMTKVLVGGYTQRASSGDSSGADRIGKALAARGARELVDEIDRKAGGEHGRSKDGSGSGERTA